MRRRKDQVTIVQDWQLPPPEEATWEPGVKDPTYSRMLALSQDINDGLRDPRSGRDDNTIVNELPRKKHPRLPKTFGTQGWGLHVAMGFSFRRLLWWVAFCAVLCVAYAILMFLLFEDTQVTTALAPPTVILSLFSVVLAGVQKTEEVWHARNKQPGASSATGTSTDLRKESSQTQSLETLEEEACSSTSPAPLTTSMRPESAAFTNFSRKRTNTSENSA